MSYLEDLVEDMRYDSSGKLVCNDDNIHDYVDLYYDDPTMFPHPQPIGEWNVSAVTNMEYLFMDKNEFDEPLNNWDVRNLVLIKLMFKNATSFDQDISSWDLGNVNLDTTVESQIFFNCPIRNEYKPQRFQSQDVPFASVMPATEDEYLPEQEGGYYKKTKSRRRKSRSKRRRNTKSRSRSRKQ